MTDYITLARDMSACPDGLDALESAAPDLVEAALAAPTLAEYLRLADLAGMSQWAGWGGEQ
jgi:hypothetical protein